MDSGPPLSPWTFRVRNFRALDALEWSPRGVCLLAGPNGSGKSTLLKALQFPRFLFSDGLTTALRYADGASSLRRLGAADDEPVVFETEFDAIRWRVEIPVEGVGVHPYFGERVTRGDVVELEARPYESTMMLRGQMVPRDPKRCGLQGLWKSEFPAWLRRFVTRVTEVRVHYSYGLESVRQRGSGSQEGADYLHPTGRNLWAVLGRWGNSANLSDRQRVEWVLDQARRAFPDILSDIRFEAGEPRLYIPGHEEQGLPIHLAADGLLVGLMHLTAVAGTPPGGFLAFDELENQLHPHAIRSILAAMRERADADDLTIVLTTHSPVLMNQFEEHKESFFILDRSSPLPMPVPLLQAKDPKWLRHFSLGDLYDREEFAAPRLP